MQGEVEAIAMMKPKASVENNRDASDGLLEYIEDVIGTSSFREPIDTAEKQYDAATVVHLEGRSKISGVEAEVDALRKERDAAVKAGQTELSRMQLLALSERVSVQLARNHVGDSEADLASAEAQFASKAEGGNAARREMTEIDGKLAAANAAKAKLEKAQRVQRAVVATAGAAQKKAERDKAKVEATVKRAKDQLVKLERQRDDLDAEIARLEAEEPLVETRHERAEREYDAARDKYSRAEADAKERLQPIHAAIQAAKAAVVPIAAETEKAVAAHHAAELALADCAERLLAVKEPPEQLARLGALEATAATKKVERDALRAELETTKGSLRELRTRRDELQKASAAAERDASQLAATVSDLRRQRDGRQQASMAAKVLSAHFASDPGRYFGRLGDLGAIADQYDVAISSACGGALGSFVVDTMDTAVAAVKLLQAHKGGYATFVVLEEVGRRLAGVAEQFTTKHPPSQFPKGVVRLFDQVTCEPFLRVAFYHAMRNVMVCPNLDMAADVAKGRHSKGERLRAVTLDGQTAEVSGAVAGGGGRPRRGAMGNAPAVSERDMADAEGRAATARAAAEAATERLAVAQRELLTAERRAEELSTRADAANVEAVRSEAEARGLRRICADAEAARAAAQKRAEAARAKEPALRKAVADAAARLEDAQARQRAAEATVGDQERKLVDAGGTEFAVLRSTTESAKVAFEQERTCLASVRSRLAVKRHELARVAAELEARAREAGASPQAPQDASPVVPPVVRAAQALEAATRALDEAMATAAATDAELVETEAELSRLDKAREAADATLTEWAREEKVLRRAVSDAERRLKDARRDVDAHLTALRRVSTEALEVVRIFGLDVTSKAFREASYAAVYGAGGMGGGLPGLAPAAVPATGALAVGAAACDADGDARMSAADAAVPAAPAAALPPAPAADDEFDEGRIALFWLGPYDDHGVDDDSDDRPVGGAADGAGKDKPPAPRDVKPRDGDTEAAECRGGDGEVAAPASAAGAKDSVAADTPQVPAAPSAAVSPRDTPRRVRQQIEAVRLKSYGKWALPDATLAATDAQQLQLTLDDALARADKFRKEFDALKKDVNAPVIRKYREKALRLRALKEEVRVAEETEEAARIELDRLTTTRLRQFQTGLRTINQKLKSIYRTLTFGGDAQLEQEDTLDPFTDGLSFSVRPPNKTWKNIQHLSGGEKTLSSLSLVFALHYYKPSPFYVMDEIDAALDFRNVSIVANFIVSQSVASQFLIISLRPMMFELAPLQIGIYKVRDCTRTVVFVPAAYVIEGGGARRASARMVTNDDDAGDAADASPASSAASDNASQVPSSVVRALRRERAKEQAAAGEVAFDLFGDADLFDDMFAHRAASPTGAAPSKRKHATVAFSADDASPSSAVSPTAPSATGTSRSGASTSASGGQRPLSPSAPIRPGRSKPPRSARVDVPMTGGAAGSRGRDAMPLDASMHAEGFAMRGASMSSSPSPHRGLRRSGRRSGVSVDSLPTPATPLRAGNAADHAREDLLGRKLCASVRSAVSISRMARTPRNPDAPLSQRSLAGESSAVAPARPLFSPEKPSSSRDKAAHRHGADENGRPVKRRAVAGPESGVSSTDVDEDVNPLSPSDVSHPNGKPVGGTSAGLFENNGPLRGDKPRRDAPLGVRTNTTR